MLLRDFKSFLLRGNVLDLAVAFILGAAFSAVVQSFADDVLMATIAAVFGQPDFSDIIIPLGAGGIRIGSFLTAIVNLLLVGAGLFLIVRAAARLSGPDPEESPTPPSEEVVLLTDIRDALTTSGR